MIFKSFVILIALFSVAQTNAQGLERSSPDCSPNAISNAQEGAESNEGKSLYLMARYYSTGKCMPGDGAKALEYYGRAVQINYPPAFYNLGMILAANQKFRDAESYFFRGAMLGHRGCELQLGILYFLVPPPVGNDQKAFGWLSLSASRDDAIASEAKDMLEKVSRRLTDEDKKRASLVFMQLQEKYKAVPAFQD